MSFSTLGLGEPLLRAIADHEYSEPTAVQHAVIPEVLAGRDVWARASTGSGKTAAFVLPILERRARALVVVPTRELAQQTAETIASFSRHLERRPKTVVVLGGVSIHPQMMALRGGADIVVATPGRLLDLVAKNALSLDVFSVLVLDEADRLLDIGFAEELARVVALLPSSRQTLLFSATFPDAVSRLAEQLLRAPVRAFVADTPAEVPAIEERAIEVDAARRAMLLRQLLEQNDWARVLVFVATTHSTEHLVEKLRAGGVDAVALHGGLSQGARTGALDAFRRSAVRVLVATDLAARGLDVTGLPAVIQYDLPRSPTDYVHRIGRTARAGATGVAISFVTAEATAHFTVIERRIGRSIPRERVAGFEPVQAPVAPSSAGGVKGKRKSKKDRAREAAARAQKG